MEDMLIACVKSYMQVRWTKGRQLCYNDHIINFHQDISEVAMKLPCLPEETDIVIIQKEDVELNRHVDFIVWQEKVREALEYKISHDPEYANLRINQDALNQLPENGSVTDHLPVCQEGRQDGGPAMPVGPDAAAAPGDVGDVDGQLVVGGVLDLGNPECLEVQQLRQGAREVLRAAHYQQTIVSLIAIFQLSYFSYHTDGLKINTPPCDPTPLSESTPGYMTKAFPQLFQHCFQMAREISIRQG